MTIAAARVAYGVRLSRSGLVPDDDAFTIEPGRSRTITMRPGISAPVADAATSVSVRALNLLEPLEVPLS